MKLPNILRLIFPSICPLCQESGVESEPICKTCYSELNSIHGKICSKCGAPLLTDHSLCRECTDNPRIWWQSAASAFCFDGLARAAIHRFKYHGDVSLIPFLADASMTAWNTRYPDKQVDCVIPVPLHWLRKMTRGYNQAEMVCAEISRTHSIPLECGLKRVRWTSPQAHLSKSKRSRNLKNAFVVVNKEAICGKRVLLFDDVMTTGSTLNECSRRLVKAGATEVNILTIARRL